MTYPPQPGRQPPYPPSGVPWPPYPRPGFPPQPPPPPPGYAAPYGQAYAAPPFAQYPYGPPKRSRRALWILSVVALAAVVATAVVIVIAMVPESDEAQIKSTISQFAAAVDDGNLPKAVSYVCTEEAKQITERDDYDANASKIEPGKRLPVNVTDVQITGDAAVAQLSRPPQKPRKLHLKKEAGTWKLCDPGPP